MVVNRHSTYVQFVLKVNIWKQIFAFCVGCENEKYQSINNECLAIWWNNHFIDVITHVLNCVNSLIMVNDKYIDISGISETAGARHTEFRPFLRIIDSNNGMHTNN